MNWVLENYKHQSSKGFSKVPIIELKTTPNVNSLVTLTNSLLILAHIMRSPIKFDSIEAQRTTKPRVMSLKNPKKEGGVFLD